MTANDYLSIITGLALFLFGMKAMGQALEALAGSGLEPLLRRLTRSKASSVAVGAGVTAVIQSSDATAIMSVGLVNRGILEPKRALWVIMGAKVGTTVTAQLLALDLTNAAPVVALFGVCLMVFCSKPKICAAGQAVGGFGFLFIGMGMMGAGMGALAGEGWFEGFTRSLSSNPLLGICAGAAAAAIIQSSSASVGVFQALTGKGLIGFAAAAPVVAGMNIGAGVTAVLYSLGAGKKARRTAAAAFLFPVAGTLIFLALAYVLRLPLLNALESLTPGDAPRQLANFHTAFNLISLAALLPCDELLMKAARRVTG